MANKTILKSKTFWVQVITGAAAFVPSVRDFVTQNPVPVLTAFAAVNTAVRFVTFGRVRLFEPEG